MRYPTHRAFPYHPLGKRGPGVGTSAWLIHRRSPLLVALGGFMLVVGVGGCGPKRVTTTGDQPAELGLPTSSPAEPLFVRIGLTVGADRAELVASGDLYLLVGEQRQRQARLPADQVLVVVRQGRQLGWLSGTSSGTAEVLTLQAVDPAHRIAISATGNAAEEVRGEVLIRRDRDGAGLTLINILELEDYLCGVVPWEIGRLDSDARAALAAQAVAARTYTVAHLGTRERYGFDLWATVQDQVYRGSRDEDALCNEAIRQTAGRILTHQGQPIDAFYSSTCGGMASQVEEVWPRAAESYLVAHADAPRGGGEAFCAGSRYFRWRESWSAEQLEDILNRNLPAYVEYMSRSDRAAWAGPVFSPYAADSDPGRPGNLLGLEIKGRTRSGRIARLDVQMTAGIYHLRGDRVRWVLRPYTGKPSILRSAFFRLEVSVRDGRPQQIVVRGQGFGHGVGMCQNGAVAMARTGYDVEQILAHYYPGASLAPLQKREL